MIANIILIIVKAAMSRILLCFPLPLTMPPTAHLVLCSCCNKYITRRREIAHRAALAAPALPSHHTTSRLHPINPAVLDSDESSISNGPDLSSPAHEGGLFFETNDGDHNTRKTTEDNMDIDTVLKNIYQRQRRPPAWVTDDQQSEMDSEEELRSDGFESVEDSGSEDGEDDANANVNFPDWDTFDNPGLDAWDQLGESFEREAAEICVFHCLVFNLID